jgi:hypothetical protein
VRPARGWETPISKIILRRRQAMRLRRWTISCALHKDLDLQNCSASSRDGERIFVKNGARAPKYSAILKSYNDDLKCHFHVLSPDGLHSSAQRPQARHPPRVSSSWQCFSRRPSDSRRVSYRDSEANRHSSPKNLTANALRSLSELSRTANPRI